MRGLFALLLLASAHLASAETAFVAVDLDPERITVGDRVRARLTLVWDGTTPTAAPVFPDWRTKTWGEAEILEAGGVETVSNRAGRRIYTQTLTLTAFETGEVELPPRLVTIRLAEEKTVEVPTRVGARLTVDSVLPSEEVAGTEELEPKPPASLLALPGNLRFLWMSSALAVLSLAAFALLWLRVGQVARAAEIAARPPPLLPPLEEILETLRRIDVRRGSEPVATAMSLALRRFLGRTLSFNAVESTTSEIERTLGRGPLAQELAEGAVELLRDCDQVKYARLEVREELAAERLEFLGDLAHEIDRQLRPPEPEEATP